MSLSKRSAFTVIGLVLLTLSTASAALGQAEAKQQGVVNINTATREQLMLLPRVGPAVAGRILEYREANDGFEATEELLLVRGIGEKTYQLIEPYVTVKGDTTLTEKVSSRSRAKQAD